MCQLLRTAAMDLGLSEVEIADHILTPRVAEASFYWTKNMFY